MVIDAMNQQSEAEKDLMWGTETSRLTRLVISQGSRNGVHAFTKEI
jgi:hypothetical protein